MLRFAQTHARSSLVFRDKLYSGLLERGGIDCDFGENHMSSCERDDMTVDHHAIAWTTVRETIGLFSLA